MRGRITGIHILEIAVAFSILMSVGVVLTSRKKNTTNTTLKFDEFNPCYHLREASSENYTVTIKFSRPIPEKHQKVLNSYFGYQTMSFGLPLVMRPGIPRLLSASQLSLKLEFPLPFIQNYTGFLVCVDPSHFKPSPFQIPKDILPEVDNYLPLEVSVLDFYDKMNSIPKNGQNFEGNEFLENKENLSNHEKKKNLKILEYPKNDDHQKKDDQNTLGIHWSQMKCFGNSFETRFCDMRRVAIYRNIFVFATEADYIFPEPFLSAGARSAPFDREEGRLIYEPVVIHEPITEIARQNQRNIHNSDEYDQKALKILDSGENNQNQNNVKQNNENQNQNNENHKQNNENQNQNNENHKQNNENQNQNNENQNQNHNNENQNHNHNNENQNQNNEHVDDKNIGHRQAHTKSKFEHLSNISYVIARFYNSRMLWHTTFDFLVPAFHTFQLFEKDFENGFYENRHVFLRDYDFDAFPELISSMSTHRVVELYLDNVTRLFDRVIVGLEKLEKNPSAARTSDEMLNIQYDFRNDTAIMLRNSVLKSLNVQPEPIDSFSPLVLIVERLGTSRLFLNIDEIEEYMLSRCDFCRVKRVDFAEYSVPEQIELTSSASVLFGAHGSGLSNCLWMPPSTPEAPTALIEVLPHGYHCRDWFHGAANVSRVDYYSVMSGKKGIHKDLPEEQKNHIKSCWERKELCSTFVCHDTLRDQNISMEIGSFSSVWMSVVGKLKKAQRLADAI
ncbi:hypothetical protein TRFO_11941 [Tritrichomonas foetus]|uniref:Glycosyltransferase 61 catalytic domain-containing protein n=1 Tax=Tritrichomonas foetus TaxID=1144522 RepID=A0A1J4J585_9EUKA|nr:hypothetical protein TRFO_11941 [Tritrichomonas foetus]|eukprot:OHS93311.1 hypothetical protein TRFO_11941 [Tritrichomonas foetus]